MMNWVWFLLILASVAAGAAFGRMGPVSQAALSGATDAVTLFLVLLATICLWSGLMKIAQAAGLTQAVQRLLRPVTKRLFPDLAPEGEAMQAISMNITANLLGLGNAATPLGLAAMRAMRQEAGGGNTATNSMALFVVLNTASIQLIPTTIAAIRLQHSAAAPFDILPALWLSSFVTLCFGVLMAKLLARGGRGKDGLAAETAGVARSAPLSRKPSPSRPHAARALRRNR